MTLSPRALNTVAAYLAKMGAIASLFQPPKRSCNTYNVQHSRDLDTIDIVIWNITRSKSKAKCKQQGVCSVFASVLLCSLVKPNTQTRIALHWTTCMDVWSLWLPVEGPSDTKSQPVQFLEIACSQQHQSRTWGPPHSAHHPHRGRCVSRQLRIGRMTHATSLL